MPLSDYLPERHPDEEAPPVAFVGRKAEAIHRLQVGVFGLGAMVLMVSLANIVMERARESEKTAVPEAVSTVAPSDKPASNKDPLADAGVAPDLPAQPTASATPSARPDGDNGASSAQP